MSLNKLIAGVAIAGLTVVTTIPTVASFAVERGSSQIETQQYAQRRDNWDRYAQNRRFCYYVRRGRRLFYCCRQRYWNGRFYEWRTFCRPVRG
ncbi:hypothetical protein ACE1B6_09075 [Aerosakkonemataceae cyanobacterium BLCC-F154]|uniref:Uncharacterized protein n=1 Tax=Floridaenema fluviatile BLCC-F154 TaxID=3153640 RepID=A0ABV4Y9R1_9CYAN